MKPDKSEKVDQLIEALPKNIQEITTSLRNLIFETSDNFIEEIKWSKPSYGINDELKAKERRDSNEKRISCY